MMFIHPPSPCSAPPSPGRGLPPHCSAFAFPRAAVKPLLSARCQERSKHRSSAQPSQAAGAGEQAQAWLTAQLSLSLPALVHKQWGEPQLHPRLGTSPRPASRRACRVGAGEPQRGRGLQPELLRPSRLVQGCWRLSQEGLPRGWGIPWDSCREGVLHPLLQPGWFPSHSHRARMR